MKRLSQLLSDIEIQEIIGNADPEVTSIVTDSRKMTGGAMFVALRGVNVDSHRFIPAVADAGAVAIVCEELPARLESTVTYIRVSNTAVALGYIASAWNGEPSSRLTLVGVTGTNGKTTTATLLYEMARLRGLRAGLISTVCNYIDDKAVEADHTTPDPLTINSLLADMVEAGCTHAFMEVSSHAAHQHRIAGLKFAGGIFTNLTRDHLDYHKTVDAYIKAKKSFFDNLSSTAWALTNDDDRVGQVMLQNTRARRLTYALQRDADFRCRIIDSRLDGMLLSLNGHEVETMFTGRFNAYNLTAVFGASMLLWPGDIDRVLVDMSRLVPVSGRFQTLRSTDGRLTAIVDYAHTPDAIVNVLDTVRNIVGDAHAIITVTGAGGNRDTGKRPIMAAEAAHRSDRLILTSDNPRDEDPDDIIAQMKAGLDDEGNRKTIAITDRREAIRAAIALAADGDVIVVAGKGHETYQEIKGVKHHFDDREVILQAFGKL